MTEKQKSDIENALLIGMAVEDAYVYAGLSPREIEALAENDEWQRNISRRVKQHEYSLLSQLGEVAERQIRMGKEGAITWALEHMYPRYSNKPTVDGQPLTINLNVDGHNADIETDE